MDVYLPEDYYLIRAAEDNAAAPGSDENRAWLGGEALVAPAAPFAASREQAWNEANAKAAPPPNKRKRFTSVTDFDWRTL